MSLKEGPKDGKKEEDYNIEKMIHHVLENINGLEQPRVSREEIITNYKNEIQQPIPKKIAAVVQFFWQRICYPSGRRI
jgi:hypothetical protein